MSETASTFTLFSSRWAKKLIHSHAWALDERKSWYIRTLGLSSLVVPGLGKRKSWYIRTSELCMYVLSVPLIESSKVRMYKLFAHRERTSANVSAFSLIESSTVRMYQLVRSSRAQQCECITFVAHRELKSAIVSAFSLIRVLAVQGALRIK